MTPKLPLALVACALYLEAQPLVVRQVTVIDTEAGRARPEMTVIVAGDRIAAVGASRRTRPPRGARILEGRGKFLIPGLWDMHVHLAATLPPDPKDPALRGFFAPHFAAHGITGVRSMFENLAAVRELRADIAAGRVAGPRIVASGPILDGPQPFWQGSIACANAGQGRAAVERVRNEGADFVKVYSQLPRDAYLAIAAEARKRGLAFAGHVPNSVSAAEASDAGQKSIEHLLGVFLSCSSREQELATTGKFGPGLRAAAESYDPQKAAALFAKFAKNGTWQTPTLVALRYLAYSGDPALNRDERLRYIPQPILEFWKAGWPATVNDDAAERRLLFERELRLVGAMHRAGVRILAGTDTPNPYVFPGSGLHDELELLVKAGLPPMEALRAATIRPAEYLGTAGRLGSIAPGKLADLVLLDGDPLAEIGNVRRIGAVVLNGRLLEKAELDRLYPGRRD